MKKSLSCTSILIGKNATADGSTIVARNEDGYAPVGPKQFVVRPAKDQKNAYFVSHETGVKIPLPDHAYRYTAEPSVADHPVYEEAGINEKNVAMSATETTFTNQRFLGFDPLVDDGVNEECMVTVVLPYINSALEGVKRFGHLIEKYGTGQSNGIAFSDHNEIWYLETAGGHHWAAVRIPDDAYAVAPNQINIQEIKFDDPDHYLTDPDLKNFVEKYHLNNDPKHFNFRNIAGTHTEADAHYNTPRAWYGQKLFTPDVQQEPTSQNIPFLQHANRKLAVEDVEYFLSSHYQQTPYDPFTHANELKKQTFRSIALDRNQISHILQIRNDVDPKYAALEWMAMGFLAYSPYVPFYANINQTPFNYQKTGNDFDINSAYWMYKLVAVLAEPHYHAFINDINAYREACQSYALNRIKTVDAIAKKLDGKELTEKLTNESIITSDKITRDTNKLIDRLVKGSLNRSKITFESGDNL
ncbi:dipeptidase [Philodulcilactobacillus myokoensis]|uniref:Dipeptidase n=1 Tax=Philodulcilactobacillus myokoensis TaxID=2929573 RepID=A0A9W6B1C3_9LACO|nr:C69 family dipeptidase [Philodulcilactobacillus myokoensis]GLB46319.1 dipeptidase [Philodulcilactobacillus myokoensis]